MRGSGIVTYTYIGCSSGARHTRKISAVLVPGVGAAKIKSITRHILDSWDILLVVFRALRYVFFNA
jgi:hypothetical protein